MIRSINFFFIFCGAGIFSISCNESMSSQKQAQSENSIFDEQAWSENDILDQAKQSITPDEYKLWVLSHCRQKVHTPTLSYTLLFKPHDYIICLTENAPIISQQEHDSVLQEIDGLEYFDLRISLNQASGNILEYNLADKDSVGERVKFLAFKFSNQIDLICNKGDTIHPAIYHFEQAFGITPYVMLSFGFPVEKICYSSDAVIVIRDQVLGEQTVEFKFPANRLKHLPKLKTNSSL